MEITLRYFSIGGFEIYWYGVLIGLGVLAAVLAASKREKVLGLRDETALTLALAVVPFGIIGARLYYVLFHPEYYHSLKEILNLRDGGLAIYGGLIFGLIAGTLTAQVRRQSVVRLCDLAFPCVALAQAIGRWGNFLNQEAHGMLISNAALQFFPVAVYIRGSWYAATFFYESLWCLSIYLVICCLPSRKWFLQKGEGLLGYMTLYSFERCAVEGLRTDSLYLGAARVSQLLSAVILCVCCAWLLRRFSAKPVIWTVYALCAAALMLSASALLPFWAMYIGLPALFALCVFAWWRTRRTGKAQSGTEE